MAGNGNSSQQQRGPASQAGLTKPAPAEIVALDMASKLPALAKLSPVSSQADLKRMHEVCMVVFRNDTKLRGLTAGAIWMGVYDIFKLGLDPDPTKKCIWIFPRDGKCVVDIAPEGYKELARAAGITGIAYHIVHEGDLFEQEESSDGQWYKYKEAWTIGAVKGKAVGAYCAWIDPNGTKRVVTYPIEDLYKLRDSSLTYRSDQSKGNSYSPWTSWPERMLLAKVIRQTAKDHWPKTASLANAITASDGADAGFTPDVERARVNEMRSAGLPVTFGNELPPAGIHQQGSGRQQLDPSMELPPQQQEQNQQQSQSNSPSPSSDLFGGQQQKTEQDQQQAIEELKNVVYNACNSEAGVTMDQILDEIAIAIPSAPSESVINETIANLIDDGYIRFDKKTNKHYSIANN